MHLVTKYSTNEQVSIVDETKYPSPMGAFDHKFSICIHAQTQLQFFKYLFGTKLKDIVIKFRSEEYQILLIKIRHY